MSGKKKMSNKLILGNCYELIKDIPDNSVDLIVTDPPYEFETRGGGIAGHINSIREKYNQIEKNNLQKGIDTKILPELVRVQKNINCYIWCNNKQIPLYFNFFINKLECNFDILIWNKTDAAPFFSNKYLTDKEYLLYFRRGGYCNPNSYEEAKTVYQQVKNRKNQVLYGHPTIKPLNIIETIVKNSSKEGQTVLDPFMGSGTTGVACKKLNRNFIGMEIDKDFYEICCNRINNVTAEHKEQLELFQEEL